MSKIDPAYSSPATSAEDDKTRFRRTLVKVLAMQVVALALLAWLQLAFTP